MDGWWDYIKDCTETAGIVIENIDSYKKLLKVLMSNINIAYRPQGQISQKLVVVKAEAGDWIDDDSLLEWLSYAPLAQFMTIGGDHQPMVKGENAIMLADELRKLADELGNISDSLAA